MTEYVNCLDTEYAALAKRLGFDSAQHAKPAWYGGITLAFPVTLICERNMSMRRIAKDGCVLNTSADIRFTCL